MNLFDLAMAKKMFGGSGGGAAGGDSGNIAKGLCEGVAFDLTGDNVELVEDHAFNFDGYGSGTIVPKLKVKSVNLPNATKIGRGAFRLQEELVNVDLPKSTFIGSQAFFNCSALTSVKLGEVEEIANEAFCNCENLEKVDAQSAEMIWPDAFNNCQKLTAFIIRSKETGTRMDFSAFYETPIFNLTGHFYVSTSMYESYRTVYSDALDAAYAEIGVTIDGGIFNVMFRKIEDYPEICG